LAAGVNNFFETFLKRRFPGQCGVERAAIPMLRASSSVQWTAGFNPRPVAKEDFVNLYEAAFDVNAGGQAPACPRRQLILKTG
jgi:alcohol dehydrogenase class IV